MPRLSKDKELKKWLLGFSSFQFSVTLNDFGEFPIIIIAKDIKSAQEKLSELYPNSTVNHFVKQVSVFI